MSEGSLYHARLPYAPWRDTATDRLPGMVPVALDTWLRVDETYGAQLARRRSLLASERARVIAALPDASPAMSELYETVVATLAARLDFSVGSQWVTCPDGARVARDPADPLGTLGCLCQEDFCIMEREEGGAPDGGEHALTAAVLCFPANWTLAEKIGQPLTRIHRPVPAYLRDGAQGLAPRVQRLFDALAPGRVLMRMNANWTDAADPFSPRLEADGHELADGRFMRVERQTLRRLPQTGAVVFGIHTCLVPREGLSAEDRAGHARYAALQSDRAEARARKTG
ncbi:MAG: DUF3445 domain-containing protein [Pseudomonadota bacterium]